MTTTPAATECSAGRAWPLAVLGTGVAVAVMLTAVTWCISDWVERRWDEGLLSTIESLVFLSLPYGLCAAGVSWARGHRALRRVTKAIAILVLLCSLPAVVIAVHNAQEWAAPGRRLAIQTHLVVAFLFALFIQGPLGLVSVLLGWIARRDSPLLSADTDEPAW